MLCGKTDGLVLFSFCIIYYTIAVVLNGKRFNLEFSQSNRNVGNLQGENMRVQCLRKSRQKMSETFILVRLMLSRKLQGIVDGMFPRPSTSLRSHA